MTTIPRETISPQINSNANNHGDAPAAAKIEAENLDFFYGAVQALYGVSIRIPARQVTALIGPSGCGKSTFLRTLNRMNDLVDGAHHTGSVRLDGEDIYQGNTPVEEIRARVGMVFQKPNPFPSSIFDNIAYGPRLQGTRRKSDLAPIVERALRQAAVWDEVKDKLRASAFALSGGQQQRLCIARVLAVEPDVLLMDEPTSALDPNATHRIEELVHELKSAYTIVIVTHNMQQAARISDQTGFFLRGILKEFEATEAIFNTPREQETQDYVRGKFG